MFGIVSEYSESERTIGGVGGLNIIFYLNKLVINFISQSNIIRLLRIAHIYVNNDNDESAIVNFKAIIIIFLF